MRTTITIEVQNRGSSNQRIAKRMDPYVRQPIIGRVRKVRGAANADNDNYRSPKIAAPQSLSPRRDSPTPSSQQIINHEGAT
jgi:hypothetical protein